MGGAKTFYPPGVSGWDTSTIRFSLRPYLPEPYNSPAYASGLYTTGWMKAVPASASWDETARAYNEEYRNGLSAEFVEAHRAYAVRLGELSRVRRLRGRIHLVLLISAVWGLRRT